MFVSRAIAAIVLSCLLTFAPAASAGVGEREVVAALNQARAHPQALVADLRRYRGAFHANLVATPGGGDLETVEGVRPVDEAILFVIRLDSATTLLASTTLAEAAADHVAEQRATGQVGHAGTSGLTPSQRVTRRGGGPLVAELIAYGARDATELVRQLIVDDGVGDRGHRRILFAAHLRYIGVACGAHPVFETMCVIDLAETPDGREPDAPLLEIAYR